MPALRLPVPSGTSSVSRPMRGIHCRFGAYIQCALTGETEKNRTISDFDEGAGTREKPTLLKASLFYLVLLYFRAVILLLHLWRYRLCHRGECRVGRCAALCGQKMRRMRYPLYLPRRSGFEW